MLNLGLKESDVANYSVARAILAADNPKRNAGFEAEVSADIAKKLGRPCQTANAVFIPTRLNPRASGLDTKTSAAGRFVVETEIRDLIEALRAQSRCVQLGAQLLDGLSANISFAVESTTGNASWVVENPGSDVGDSDTIFAQKTAVPHTLQSTTSFSRQLLNQNSVSIESFLRRSITKSHAVALDQAAINGTGTVGQPTGLLKQANLPTVSIGTDGGVATYAHLCSLEETVALANADFPEIAFLTTPTQRRKLRTVFQNGTGSAPAWNDEVPGPLGYRGAVSTAVPSNLTKGSGTNLSAIVAGNFSYMLLTEFGVLEIVVDPYALKRQGMIQITSFSLCDVMIQQLAAFAAITDAS